MDNITYNIGVFDGSVYDSKGHRIMSKDDLQTAAFVLNELTKISETWISDTHLCNEAQQLHMINKVYEETAKRGIPIVRHFGDISDGDYLNRPEHRYELFRLGFSFFASYNKEVVGREILDGQAYFTYYYVPLII